MYNLTLVNLAVDARSVVPSAQIPQRNLGPAALRTLLLNFCELDPIENAINEAEIRVQSRQENYCIRTERKHLILYDVSRRDQPAQILTVEEALTELDGTATTARHHSVLTARAAAITTAVAPVELPLKAGPAAGAPALGRLGVAAGLLLSFVLYLAVPALPPDSGPGFVPVAAPELAALQAALRGVYLTGNEPGQHGIIVDQSGELKLFELSAVAAPRVVHARAVLGRRHAQLCYRTDQLGGLIEIKNNQTLIYCGEIYVRLP